MKKREEVISMPMLRVRCMVNCGRDEGWPEFVQCLPPIGSRMRNSFGRVAFVEGYCFTSDGTIEIDLNDPNP